MSEDRPRDPNSPPPLPPEAQRPQPAPVSADVPPPLPPEAQRPAEVDVPPPLPPETAQADVPPPSAPPEPSTAAASPGAPRPAAAAREAAPQPYTPPPVYLPEPPRDEPELVDFPPSRGAGYAPPAGNNAQPSTTQPGRGRRFEHGSASQGRQSSTRPFDSRSQGQIEPQPQKRGGIPMWVIIAGMFFLFVAGAELESIIPFLIGFGLFFYVTARNRGRNRRD